MYSCIPVLLVIEAGPFLHLHKAPGCPATILCLRLALLLRLIESCASISAADGDKEKASSHLEESLEVAVMLLWIKIESPGSFDATPSSFLSSLVALVVPPLLSLPSCVADAARYCCWRCCFGCFSGPVTCHSLCWSGCLAARKRKEAQQVC